MRRIRTEPVPWAARLLEWGLLAALTLAASNLSADEGSERAAARQHFANGVTLAKQRAYAEALLEFQRAYAAVPHFSVLYNIGQAEIALGRSAEAIVTLQRYLDDGGSGVDAPRRAEVQAIIDREREKTPPAALPEAVPAAAVAPPAAPARVESAAPAPVTTPVAPQSSAAPRPVLSVGARAGDARPRSAGPTSAGAPAGDPARQGRPRVAKASPTDRRTLAYVVAGAGVALSAASFVHYTWNRSRYQQWQGKYADYFRDPTERNRLSANELSDSIDNASAVTVVLGIGAGVALGTGTVLWLTSGAPGSEPHQRALAPFFSAQGTF